MASSGVTRARCVGGGRGQKQAREVVRSQLKGPCGPCWEVTLDPPKNLCSGVVRRNGGKEIRGMMVGRVTRGRRPRVLPCRSRMSCTKQTGRGPKAAGKGLGLF